MNLYGGNSRAPANHKGTINYMGLLILIIFECSGHMQTISIDYNSLIPKYFTYLLLYVNFNLSHLNKILLYIH